MTVYSFAASVLKQAVEFLAGSLDSVALDQGVETGYGNAGEYGDQNQHHHQLDQGKAGAATNRAHAVLHKEKGQIILPSGERIVPVAETAGAESGMTGKRYVKQFSHRLEHR